MADIADLRRLERERDAALDQATGARLREESLTARLRQCHEFKHQVGAQLDTARRALTEIRKWAEVYGYPNIEEIVDAAMTDGAGALVLDRLSAIAAVVDEQAEDEGLWFAAETAPEAYLQQALRRLHAVIEEK